MAVMFTNIANELGHHLGFGDHHVIRVPENMSVAMSEYMCQLLDVSLYTTDLKHEHTYIHVNVQYICQIFHARKKMPIFHVSWFFGSPEDSSFFVFVPCFKGIS